MMKVPLILLGALLALAVPLACGQRTGDLTQEDASQDLLEDDSASVLAAATPNRAPPSPMPAAVNRPTPSRPAATPDPSTPSVQLIAQRTTEPAEPVAPAVAGLPASVTLEDPCLVSLIDEAQVPAQVTAIEGGALLKLHVTLDQIVKQGDLLGQLDDRSAEIRQNAAKARLAVAHEKAENDIGVRYSRAAFEVAKAEYHVAEVANQTMPKVVPPVEVKRLWLTAKRSELEIEQAEMQERIDTLELEVSEAELDLADDNLRRYKILSPMEGEAIVRELYRHEGEWLKPGDPVLHLIRIDKLRIEGFLNVARFDRHEVRNRPVTVTVELARDQKATFQGRVTSVDPVVQAGGEYSVWAEVQNTQIHDEWVLMPGMTVTMAIHFR